MSDAYKPSRPGNGILASHPQRQIMIDRILAGEKPGVIYREFTPPVSKVTVTLLAKQVRLQAQQAAILAKAQELQGITETVGKSPEVLAKFTRDALMGQQHLARLEEIYIPLARQVQLADAENDRQGMATVAKAAISAIRTQMEADGTLAQVGQASGNTNTFNIIVLPSSGEEEHEVIDVPVERV